MIKMLPGYGAAFTATEAANNTTFSYYSGVAGLSSAYGLKVVDGNTEVLWQLVPYVFAAC